MTMHGTEQLEDLTAPVTPAPIPYPEAPVFIPAPWYVEELVHQNRKRREWLGRRPVELDVGDTFSIVGGCSRCGRRTAAGRTCDACREEARQLRRWLQSIRWCTSCRRRAAAEDRHTCDVCLARRRRHVRSQRAAGLCTRCGKEAPEPGGRQCARCRETGRAVRQAAVTRAAGRCWRCGGETAPGSTRLCEVHLAAHREACRQHKLRQAMRRWIETERAAGRPA